MKRLGIPAAVSLLFVGACAPEASDEAGVPDAPHRAEILETVDAFFIALGAPDAEAMEDLVSPGATTVIATPDDGAVRTVLTEALLPPGEGAPFPKIRERYWDPLVLEHGGLAVVWAPYIIDVDDAFSHCGVDIFSMSLREGAWKIDSVDFTREPSGCDALGYADDLETRPDFSVLDSKSDAKE